VPALDLGPFTDLNSPLLSAFSRIDTVYDTFISTGQRFLCLIDADMQLAGSVTRRELWPEGMTARVRASISQGTS
jgi:hypothetical protein